MSPKIKPIRVLLVEDNLADIELTKAAMEAQRVHIDLVVAMDGHEALDVLHRRGANANTELPDLVMLDLNIPRVSGRDILAEIKTTPRLKLIPVVVLSSSTAESDVLQSYDLGANCYVTKPIDLRSFEQIVQALKMFWFTVVKLPQPGSDG